MQDLRFGCSKALGLVHEHVKSNERSDHEYEKQRYSYDILLQSAKYFEQKNGFTVWSEGTEKWLEEQEKRLDIVRNNKNKYSNDTKPIKTKIALIVDVRNWALDNIAKNIVKYLGDKYDFKIIYMEDIPDLNIVYVFYACKDCNIIHFLWRGFINFIDGDFTKQYLSYYGRGQKSFIDEVINKSLITFSVYDHNYLEENFDITETIFKYSNYYTVSSEKLYQIYSNLGFKKPIMKITDGIDIEKFKPTNLERFNNIENRQVIIGWVGNSKWNAQEDHKGIHTIIEPAIKELINEGYNVELKTVDKEKNFMKHDDMPNYYNQIDIYVCASANEGTPNPILEAMACGAAIISTDVGIVPELLGAKQKEYIMEERTKECLKNKIKKLLENKNEIKNLSKENMNIIKEWKWENKCKQFDDFFNYVLNDIKE